MPSVSVAFVVVALTLVSVSAPPRPTSLAVVHEQRYSMGTMFDIIVYHTSRADAERAVERAFAEILRLDDLLSHYKPESALSKLNRDGRNGPVSVDGCLYEVIAEAAGVSRLSAGKFDITVAPLLKVWRRAAAEGRRPTDAEIAEARRCVGYQHIELTAPDRVQFRSDCVELDLGGIGKGYAVDRAMAILTSGGIQHAMINAGGSSIAAVGAPPGRSGWPVVLGGPVSGGRVLLLHGTSISTSQQNAAAAFGDTIEPAAGLPAETRMAISVIARSATLADALSTTLLMVPMREAAALLRQFEHVSAVWVTPSGEVQSIHRASHVEIVDALH